MSEARHALAGALDARHATETLACAKAIVGSAPPGADLTVDCSEVTRVDGAGAQVLVALARALAKEGRRLRLVGMPEGPRALLERTGLSPHVGLETEEEQNA